MPHLAFSHTVAASVHITSGSKNQAVLPKRHDYIPVLYFSANKNRQ